MVQSLLTSLSFVHPQFIKMGLFGLIDPKIYLQQGPVKGLIGPVQGLGIGVYDQSDSFKLAFAVKL